MEFEYKVSPRHKDKLVLLYSMDGVVYNLKGKSGNGIVAATKATPEYEVEYTGANQEVLEKIWTKKQSKRDQVIVRIQKARAPSSVAANSGKQK